MLKFPQGWHQCVCGGGGVEASTLTMGTLVLQTTFTKFFCKTHMHGRPFL